MIFCNLPPISVQYYLLDSVMTRAINKQNRIKHSINSNVIWPKHQCWIKQRIVESLGTFFSFWNHIYYFNYIFISSISISFFPSIAAFLYFYIIDCCHKYNLKHLQILYHQILPTFLIFTCVICEVGQIQKSPWWLNETTY